MFEATANIGHAYTVWRGGLPLQRELASSQTPAWRSPQGSLGTTCLLHHLGDHAVKHRSWLSTKHPPFTPPFLLNVLLFGANLLSSFRHRNPVSPLTFPSHLNQTSGFCQSRVLSKVDDAQSRVDSREARLDQLVASRSELTVL